MKLLIMALALILLVAAAYVRLAPVRPETWHIDLSDVVRGDTPTMGSFAHRRPAERAAFERLDDIIRATARTRVIAGSRDEGRITYETRSLLWGFPDYTTLQWDGSDLIVLGRLRFGKGDMGVNKARITGWLATLDQG